MAYLAMSPVAVAIYGKLNVSSLTSGLGYTVGLYDDVSQDAALPLVWIELPEESSQRGMGTGEFGRVEIRVHVFSNFEGTAQVQLITAKVIELLRDQALTVTGYAQAGLVFYDHTTLLNDVVFHGIKCREMVAFFYTFVEEA